MSAVTPGQFHSLFDSRLDASTGCWLWTGKLNKDGYVNVKVGQVTTLLHRLAWETFRGALPPGFLVCHNCPGGDNRACSNPWHMFPGTAGTNNMDRGRKHIAGPSAPSRPSRPGRAAGKPGRPARPRG